MLTGRRLFKILQLWQMRCSVWKFKKSKKSDHEEKTYKLKLHKLHPFNKTLKKKREQTLTLWNVLSSTEIK